jgi:MFS transporter, PPP family, 3-phenylpropionic acid transporter
VTGGLLSGPGLHTAAFYAALFMMTGAHMPFWPLWLADWGLTPREIGWFLAIGIAVRVGAGLAVPALADRLDRRRATVAVCAGISILLFLAHLAIRREATLLAATLAVGAATAGLGPIGEALGVAAARAWRFAYAPARAVGSMGFLAANLLVGVLMARLGADFVLWWIVVCLAAVAALALHHPGAGAEPVGRTPPSMRQIGRVLIDPVFAIFMAAVAFVQASHAVMYAYGSIHWRDLGIGEGRIGALWGASVAVEIVFMMTVGTRLVQRIGPVATLGVAGAAGVLRWSVMAFDPVGFWLWPIQGLHALTFAAGHLGAIAFISRAVPDRYAAAAQGAAGAMAVGAATALFTVLAAAVYPRLGGGAYALGAVSAALGLGLCVPLGRRWDGGELRV